MTLCIINKGEVDVRSFTLVGLSSKREDSGKIGKYGSGLKGAIAGLLRNKIPFEVFSGLDRFSFTTEKDNFRGTPFERILVNGEPTSITTDMHPTWVLEDFIREIYCNALDEGDVEVHWESRRPKAGHTTILINHPLEKLRKHWDKMFRSSKRTTLFEMPNNFFGTFEVLSGTPAVFCRGIWALDEKTLPENLAFAYDIDSLTVREDRKSDVSSFLCWFKNALMSSEPVAKEFFNAILAQAETSWEYNVLTNAGPLLGTQLSDSDKFICSPLEYTQMKPADQAFAIVVPDQSVRQNARAHGAKSYNDWLTAKGERKATPIPTTFAARLHEFKPYLNELGYQGNFQHFVAEPEDDRKDVIAFVRKGRCFWTSRGLQCSDAELFKTYLEETIHVEKGHPDCSRAMQECLFEHIRKLVF